MERDLEGVSPHSLVFWLQLEIHERKPDGNMSGMPIKPQERFNGIIHCKSLEEAQQKIKNFADVVREGIEDVKVSSL